MKQELTKRDRFDVAGVAQKGGEEPTHQTNQDGTEKRRPESMNFKPLDQQGGQPEAESIQHKQEKTEGDEGEWEGQENQNRPNNRIDDPQNQTCPQGREKTADFDPRDNRGCQKYRGGIGEQADEQPHGQDCILIRRVSPLSERPSLSFGGGWVEETVD